MREPKRSWDSVAITKDRQTSTPKAMITIAAQKNPISSPMTEKMKSVCFSGRNPSWVWLPVVKPWRGRLAQILAPGNGAATSLVLHAGPEEQSLSSYDEAIRTLRNSILLADFDLVAGTVGNTLRSALREVGRGQHGVEKPFAA